MDTPAKQSRARRLRGWFSSRFARSRRGPEPASEEQATTRELRGWFSSRLSDKTSGGHHRTFRGVPDFFRLAVESLKEYALITMDKDLVISSWSGPAAAMFGYTEAEIIGRKVTVLFTPEDISKGIDKQEFVDAVKKGRQDDERWHVCKDGRLLWCYGLSFPLKDEDGVMRGFVKLIRDDTARKKKDEQLRDSEERVRLAGDSTGLGTWDYDFAKKTMTISKRAAELFNLGGDPQIVGFGRFLDAIHPEDRPVVAERSSASWPPRPRAVRTWNSESSRRTAASDGSSPRRGLSSTSRAGRTARRTASSERSSTSRRPVGRSSRLDTSSRRSRARSRTRPRS